MKKFAMLLGIGVLVFTLAGPAGAWTTIARRSGRGTVDIKATAPDYAHDMAFAAWTDKGAMVRMTANIKCEDGAYIVMHGHRLTHVIRFVDVKDHGTCTAELVVTGAGNKKVLGAIGYA